MEIRMLHKTLSRVGPIMMAILFTACTQQSFKPTTDLGEQPTLEQARADNSPAINLFGSDGTGVHMLIRNVYDLDRNGRVDPTESTIPNWGLRLTHVSAKGTPLEASELQVTPETNAQRWQGVFVNVPAGHYKLEELSPRPLVDVSWNATMNASRMINLEAGTLVRAVEFTSICLENNQVLEFPEAAIFGTWKCKPAFDLAPRISAFTVTPNEVKAGERPTFSWKVADHASLEIDEGVGPLSAWAGSLQLTASDSARYTLTARNAFGSSQAQVSLRVGPNGTNGTFSSAGSTPGTVFSGTAGAKYFQVPGLLLNNGKVVVGKIPYETIGLDGPLQARIQGFYLFDPGSSTFSPLGQIKNPSDTQTYRYTLEDAVPLVGGKVMLHKIPDLTVPGMPELYERYDFVTDEYTRFDGPVGPTYSDSEPYQEFLVRQFAQGDKVILVIACAGDPKKVRVETYYLNTGATDSSFCATDPDYQVPNSDFTLLKDGTFLVTGGLIGQNPSTQLASASARIFDPQTLSFRKISNMKYARHLHSATLLADGRVLISGGTRGSGNEIPLQYVTESEMYDPRSEQFSQVGSMLEGRLEPTNPRTFTLPNKKLLLLDTYHPNDANAKTIFRPELFDLATGQFSATGDLLEPRSGFSAVQLQDGRVFVYGGLSSEGVPLSSAEIYTP
jgi:Galactose oxidase, central domain